MSEKHNPIIEKLKQQHAAAVAAVQAEKRPRKRKKLLATALKLRERLYGKTVS